MSDISFMDKFNMFKNLFLSSSLLIDNFMLLYLKKYDKLLTDQDRKQRDQTCNRILITSLAGNTYSILLLATQVSFLARRQFNPIRDAWMLVGILGLLEFSHAVPIAYEWPKIQQIYEKIQHDESEVVDFWADNTMSPFKIFLIRYTV